jgi:hypothetical protein
MATAFQIALAFERTVYDSLYVALAVQSEAQLITANERLANSSQHISQLSGLGRYKKHITKYHHLCCSRFERLHLFNLVSRIAVALNS